MDDARIIELGSRLFEKTELLRDGDKTSPTMKMLREDILDLAVEIQSLTTEPLEVLRTHTTVCPHLGASDFFNRSRIQNAEFSLGCPPSCIAFYQSIRLGKSGSRR